MKTKTKIVRAFLENNTSMTIKQISKSIKSDYRITHTATQRLLESQVLLGEKIGPSVLCWLNPKYYGMEIIQAEEERKKHLLRNNNRKQLHKDIITKLDTTLFILIYQATKTPDIHLTFISNDHFFKKKVEKALDLVPLHTAITVLTEEEFKRKQLHQNGIILHNVESYYLLKM